IVLGGGSSLSVGVPPFGGGAGACPLGGSATRSGSFPFISVTLNACKVATADGSVTFNGSASLQITTFNASIQAAFADSGGTPTLSATANLTGTIAPTLGGSCFVTAAT